MTLILLYYLAFALGAVAHLANIFFGTENDKAYKLRLSTLLYSIMLMLAVMAWRHL